MNGVVGATLPLAVGIAISPIPIIAAILMLLSPKATTTATGFLTGWLVGILAVTAIFTALSSSLPTDSTDSHTWIGVVKILLGLALLYMAFGQWKKRPKEGEQPAIPAWMNAIDSFTFVKALGLGVLLSGVNPKNLLLGASAGLVIGPAGLSFGETALVVVIFTVIAGITVTVPVVGYLIARDRLAGALNEVREWLEANNAVIMTVLLGVIGAVVLGGGISML